MNRILKEKAISQTPFRLELLAVFQNTKNALPISVIEKRLLSYDRITLYRTIKKFLEKGIIHEIHLAGQDKYYALCQEECTSTAHSHQHIHFRCSKCNTTSCITIENYPEVNIPDYSIEQLEIQATGICKQCETHIDKHDI